MTQETVTVNANTRAVGALLVDLVKNAKQLIADGKVEFTEVPEVLTLVLKDLVPAVQAASAVISEAQTNPADEVVTVALIAKDIIAALKG